ncbi:major histocompatibility complex class I-related gene protein-like [Bombina bombina]|uniref:major histocompatibility complex class I-related gene protein-like n=1 Tax=Bombina bombina TaxID=8345 RepID=UPI00235AE0DB|nr:major histocompatibility complex class I-related gene protein-like [Bombina bombina]
MTGTPSHLTHFGGYRNHRYCAWYLLSHNLGIYITITSAPISGLPTYSIVSHLDDLMIGRYNSDIRQVESLYIPTNESLLDELTKISQNFEEAHKALTEFLLKLLNDRIDSWAIYIHQIKFACKLYDDGFIGGFEKHALNGEEYVVFDKERSMYIPTTPIAKIITDIWNSKIKNESNLKSLIENDCIGWLNKIKLLVKNELEKKVPPKVKVSYLQSDKITKLHCFVYGFYPQAVDVKWMRNDTDDVYSEEAKQVFPNPDGTFQIRVTVEITTPMYGESFSCHVDHSSLNNTMIIFWEPKRNNSTIYIVIGFVLVTLVFAVVGIIIKKKVSLSHNLRIYITATSAPISGLPT